LNFYNDLQKKCPPAAACPPARLICNHPTNQTSNLPTNQPNKQSTKQPSNQPNKQSANQPTIQSINQTTSLYAPLLFPMNATCTTNLKILTFE
jgi:hypothetical protein